MDLSNKTEDELIEDYTRERALLEKQRSKVKIIKAELTERNAKIVAEYNALKERAKKRAIAAAKKGLEAAKK